jgi:uncharacterized protein (DUF58 family)
MQFRNFEQIGSELSPLEFYARQVVEGFITGLHKSPYHGFSVEFAEHRQYNSGESTRHIDWKRYARTERLFVKRYEEETNLRCYLALDCSGSMYYPVHPKFSWEAPNKLQYAALCGVSLMNLMRRQRDAVGLSLFAQGVDTFTPARSTTVHHRLLIHEMEQMLHSYTSADARAGNTAESLHLLAEKIHKRSLVVLFTDVLDAETDKVDEVFSALQHLKYNGHEVLMFHVMDGAHELNLDFENRPYRFVDMESGETIQLNPSEIRSKYAEDQQQRLRELKLKCAQFGIDLIEADLAKGFNDVLISYLLKRQRMRSV